MTRSRDVYSLAQGIEDAKTREAIQQLERLVRQLQERLTEIEEELEEA